MDPKETLNDLITAWKTARVSNTGNRVYDERIASDAVNAHIVAVDLDPEMPKGLADEMRRAWHIAQDRREPKE